MAKESVEKTQEEILRERADVLSRAGWNLSNLLETLKIMDRAIAFKIKAFQRDDRDKTFTPLQQILAEVNEEIITYNVMREQAKTRYYYLVVTREALGLRRHQWIDEIYRIPPRKKALAGLNGQI